MGHFRAIPVRTPGHFGSIPFQSGCFGQILAVGCFSPILAGCFHPPTFFYNLLDNKKFSGLAQLFLCSFDSDKEVFLASLIYFLQFLQTKRFL